MSLSKPEIGITIIPGKLFLHCFHQNSHGPSNVHYFMFDSCESVIFTPIYHENGPSTLPQITSFIGILKEKLLRINKPIHLYCSLNSESRVNCILLLCLFLVLEPETITKIIDHQISKKYITNYCNKTKSRTLPDYTHPLTIFNGLYPPLEEYHDALGSPFTISIKDSYEGIMKAVSHKWFDHHTFDIDTHNFYLAPENGSMGWVVPKRLLVLSAPGYSDSPLLFDMLPLFRKWHINTVVNFNGESRGFEDLIRVGIQHISLECQLDALPQISEVMKFIEICDKGETIAIASLNGLGRAPMFAAIWLVHSFGFSPKEAIAWVRTVKQGAIYGIQQDFVVRMERVFHPQVPQSIAIDKTLISLVKKNKKTTNNEKTKLHTLKLTYA